MKLFVRMFFMVAVCIAGLSGARAEDTLARIKKEGTVRIGFANEAPWSYAQSDGTITGVDYELASLVFGKLGIPNLEGVLTKFGSLVPGLKANRYDVVVAGFYIRPARCEQLAFSEPTAAIGDAIIVKAGNPKKIHSYKSVIADPSVRLAGVVGAATAQNAKAAGVPDSQISLFSDFVSALAAVKGGRADGALQTSISAQTTIKSASDPTIEQALPFEQAVINGKPTINYPGFGFRPEDADLVTAFNAELEKVLGSSEHLDILKKYGVSADTVPHGVKTAALCKP